jgi:hypothetical protein
MTERGIICTGESVMAILDERKTQTRRVVTRSNAILDGHKRPSAEHWQALDMDGAWADAGPSPAGNDGPYLKANCARPDCDGAVHRLYPQWFVGQRLWVRETWAAHWMYDDVPPREARSTHPDDSYFYLADGPPGGYKEADLLPHNCGKWRSPLYMPRGASRITLEVTGVRVERVREISEKDVRAEGVEQSMIDHWRQWLHPNDCAGHAFGQVWDSINAKRGFGWESNPWVFVIEFKKIDP